MRLLLVWCDGRGSVTPQPQGRGSTGRPQALMYSSVYHVCDDLAMAQVAGRSRR